MSNRFFGVPLLEAIMTLLCLTVFTYLTQYVYKKVCLFLRLKDIPHRNGNLLLGDAIHFKRKYLDEPLWRMRMRFTEESLRELKHPKIFVWWILWDPVISVLDYKGAEEILSSKNLLKKGKEYEFFRPWIGSGLIAASSGKWQSRRKLLTPAFHFCVLEIYIPTIAEHTQALLEKWGEKRTQTIDINGLTSQFTLDVLFETATGLPHDALLDQREDFHASLQDILRLMPLRVLI